MEHTDKVFELEIRIDNLEELVKRLQEEIEGLRRSVQYFGNRDDMI